MGLHVPDAHDLRQSDHESDSLTKSPSLRKIDGDLVNTRRFLPWDDVLVRCNQNSWFRGRIKRLERNGIRIWLLVSETLVFLPSELVSSHLVRLEDYNSGVNDSFLLRIWCVRPSHLSHRYLYERVDIVPCKRYREEAMKRSPDLKQQEVLEVSNELMCSLNRDTFYPRKPTSAGTDFSSDGFQPRLLRETNPLCCGILKDIADGVEKKVDDDLVYAERASYSPHGSEEYISAYDEAQDPDDEESMDQIRANLCKKFLARRTTLLQTSTPRDGDIPLSSRPTDAQSSGSSLETATSYLASKRDSLLFPKPVCMLTPTGNSSESTHYIPLEPRKNKDSSQHDLSKNSCIPSKPRNHSSLYSMVELRNRPEIDTLFAERKATISS